MDKTANNFKNLIHRCIHHPLVYFFLFSIAAGHFITYFVLEKFWLLLSSLCATILLFLLWRTHA